MSSYGHYMNAVGAVDMVDVQQAAAVAGRDPETIRRWIRSGRLSAQRRANCLLVLRVEVERLLGHFLLPRISLSECRDHAATACATTGGTTSATAADLVLDDRAGR